MLATVKEVRDLFWTEHPEFQNEYRKTYRQNDYRTDIRVAFVQFVDRLAREGTIDEKLASRVTL